VRRVLIAVVFVLGLGLAPAAVAIAQPAPSRMRQPEQLTEKPSGFRMTGAKAKDGAYNYRLLIAGAFCVMLTTGLVVRYLRRVNRQRPPA
jgi:hypothetical protein